MVNKLSWQIINLILAKLVLGRYSLTDSIPLQVCTGFQFRAKDSSKASCRTKIKEPYLLLLYIDLRPRQTCHSKDGGSAYSIGVGENMGQG